MSEAQKIHKYIIKSTPYGELPDVLRDLDRINPLDMKSPALLATIQEYNENHLALIAGQNKNFVIMASNKVAQGCYIDQIQSQKYTVDHIKQQIIKTEPAEIELMDQVKDLLKCLKKDVQQYLNEYYKTPNGVQVFAQISEEGLNVHVGLTSKNISIGKFYTGEWISKWKITKNQIEGIVQIKAHFFEGGNVQFNQKKQFKQQFAFTADMSENSQNITKNIKSFEATVQESLNGIYDDMPDKFFKKLRRLAPYTKTKMNWNLNAIKMNHNLLEGKEK